MALIPYTYRPSTIIRRNALRQGIFGPSLFWKIVAAGYYGRKSFKQFFGKNPEPISTEKVVVGQFVRTAAIRPMTRKERRRDRKALARVRAQALADVEAARRAS